MKLDAFLRYLQELNNSIQLSNYSHDDFKIMYADIAFYVRNLDKS